ncbi:acyltransferase domain-containing protein [Enterobacter cloacae subsp. cloacae]|uniref:type I polyketide synthase n=1 Tax=Enterobacter cloacae TaxID=550 RepID=UPI0020238090|nr:acyltransferase domain-containing protein [Enterobacter cloacae subsp. cloacae]
MKIAIVSMQGLFPGASDVTALWDNIKKGDVSISAFAPTNTVSSGQKWIHRRPLLTDPEWFDAAFFGYSSIEAEALDPQLRLLMEQGWLALEQAGATSEEHRLRTGVFAGVRHSRYFEEHLQYSSRHNSSLGKDYLQMMNRKDSAATLLAYRLGLGGPAISVNTACSTSLLAVHLACNSLLTWECDIALAGGAAIPAFSPESQPVVTGGFLSSDGLCRPFSRHANGTIDGAGVAMVALKRLEDALRDGNEIHCVIMGSAVNNDGNDKVGYSAPGINGQMRVISEALAVSEVPVDEIDYVEAHGTGTQLGDPIEFRALTQAWRKHTSARAFCSLGSIKANIGHCGAAAGVIGLIKACCIVRDGVIPPQPYADEPHPELDLENSPFRLTQRTETLADKARLRHAAVSSFGIGGTNVHMIVQQPPKRQPSIASPTPGALLLLSAKSARALEKQRDLLLLTLRERPESDLAGIANTLALGRSHFPWRMAVQADTREEAIQLLSRATPPGELPRDRAPLAFLFPGQGSQHTAMTMTLYQRDAEYRRWLDLVAQRFREQTTINILELLQLDGQALKATEYAQPALFAVEWALAQWWIAQGVVPSIMLGHSIGEWVAACLAGIFTLDDAVRLVALRGRLMQAAPEGQMLSVAAGAEEIIPLITPGVEIAVINRHDNVVVGGSAVDIARFAEKLTALGIVYRVLQTSHAFHTSSMLAAEKAFRAAVEEVPKRTPEIPLISNVTGDILTDEQALSADYWATHISKTVRFAEGVAVLNALQAGIALECGPGTVLTSLLANALPCAVRINSQPHATHETASFSTLRQAAGSVWAQHQLPDLHLLFTAPLDLHHFALPGYPFDRQRHWVMPQAGLQREKLGQLLANNGVVLTLGEQRYESLSSIQALIDSLSLPSAETVTSSPSREMTAMQPQISPSESDIHAQIAAIWRDVLGSADIDPDENFFDSGGNSLWALQIVSKVNVLYGCDIHLTELLHAATINELAALVELRLLNSVDDDALNELLTDLGELSPEELSALLDETQGTKP